MVSAMAGSIADDPEAPRPEAARLRTSDERTGDRKPESPSVLGDAPRAGLWLDPRTKIFALICASVALLGSGFGPLGIAIKAAVTTLVAVLLAASGRWRAVTPVLALFALAAALETANEAGLLALVGSTSAAGLVLRFLALLALQYVPSTALAYYLLAATKVSEFVAAMERMRLPQVITIPFAVAFRFLPTIGEEYLSIRDAMRLRGIGWRCGPIAMLEYRFVPLIASVVRIGDELSAASVTRGLGGETPRTNRCRIGFGLADAVFAAAFLACTALTAARGVAGW